MPTPRVLSRRDVLTEQLHALLPTSHPLARRTEIELADLAAEPVAFWSADAQPRGRAWLTARWSRLGTAAGCWTSR